MSEGVRASGAPEPVVAYMAAPSGTVSAGYTASVTDGVKSVAGREPTTFREFAQENQAY